MSVLVTGAAGFIGSHLVERLLGRGEAVVGLDCFDDFYDPRIKERNLDRARQHGAFREVRGDVRDDSTLSALPDEIHTIVHLAARPGVRPSIARPVLYCDVNVSGTAALLSLARDRGIRSFVFGSSSSVYGNSDRLPLSEDGPVDRPISPYAATKRSGELICHSATHLHDIRCLCLRLFTVYGPRQRPDLAIHKFARRMVDGQEIPLYGDGGTERDYTYIDDIIDGIEAGISFVQGRGASFEIVNLGGGRRVTLLEMVRALSNALGVEARIAWLPHQPGDVLRTHADVSKAGQLLGFRPSTGFEDGVEAFVRWFRDPESDRVGSS
jgi:UDP-glucuronate 4-epimerase